MKPMAKKKRRRASKPKPLLLSVNGITRGRRWTSAMIRDLLGDPDRTVPNPKYSSRAEMRLYYLDRVLQAEESPEFQSRMDAADKRRARARAAVGQEPTEPEQKGRKQRRIPAFEACGETVRLVSKRKQHAPQMAKKAVGPKKAHKQAKVSNGTREYIRTRAGHQCSYCGKPDPGNESSGFNLDHVVPRAAGGKGSRQNLVWSCVPCNVRKAALPVEEFLKDKPERLAGILAQLGQEAPVEQDTNAPKDAAAAPAIEVGRKQLPSPKEAAAAPAMQVGREQQPDPEAGRRKRPERKPKKPPAPCASCGTGTTNLMLHKEMRNGIVVRERICENCYFRALKYAIGEGDMSWARLNNEVRAVRDTIREREARERENAWRSHPATDKQIAFLIALADERGRKIPEPDNLTKGEASTLIDTLKEMPIRRTCNCCSQQFDDTANIWNRKYCDACKALTPAQRRKLSAAGDTTVH